MTQSQKINELQKIEIKDYIKDLLEYLDGRGLIVEDEDLIEEALESLGSFPRLRYICEIYPVQRLDSQVIHLKNKAKELGIEGYLSQLTGTEILELSMWHLEGYMEKNIVDILGDMNSE